VKAIELRLSEETISKEILRDLRDIVFRYPGECKLLFIVKASNGKEIVVSAGDRFNVLPCPELLDEIEALTGDKVRQLIAENRAPSKTPHQ
jgi:DNA polymerase-3 subunit alpha